MLTKEEKTQYERKKIYTDEDKFFKLCKEILWNNKNILNKKSKSKYIKKFYESIRTYLIKKIKYLTVNKGIVIWLLYLNILSLT